MQTSVKQIMIPLKDFPQVPVEATLYQAIITIYDSHDCLPDHRYHPRAVLVVDGEGAVVGKLDLRDCIRALEPKYGEIGDFNRLTHWGLNPEFVRSMVKKHDLWRDPLDSLCDKVAATSVADFMNRPQEDEYVPAEATLGEAMHQMVMGRQLSLLVTEGEKVVGFLRLCDVFSYVAGKITECAV